MKKLIAALLIVLTSALIIAGIAFASQTQDLQPAYRLMDGDEELGVVYWLDYGLLIITDNGALYTCGCEEDIPCSQQSITPTDTPPTDVPPTDTPVPPTPTNEPIPSPTPEPTDSPKCNSGGGNGSEGDPDCDPGNSDKHNKGGD